MKNATFKVTVFNITVPRIGPSPGEMRRIGHAYFDTKEAAQTASNLVQCVAGALHPSAPSLVCELSQHYPPLNGHTLTDTDTQMLRSIGASMPRNGGRIVAVKWLRGTAQCGLKEALEYFDANFPAKECAPC